MIYDRRRKIVRLSLEEREKFVEGGFMVFPGDCDFVIGISSPRFVSERFDFEFQAHDICIWSESFPLIPIDEPIPRILRRT